MAADRVSPLVGELCRLEQLRHGVEYRVDRKGFGQEGIGPGLHHGALGAGITNLIIALVITGWVHYARLVRSQVLTLKSMQYVDAARVAGSHTGRIIGRHILPNLLSSVVVLGKLQMAFVLLNEAALSFLGLGVNPSTPTWGTMINEGRNCIYNAWWVITFNGAAILLTVLAINLIGDWLRDAIDPTLRLRCRFPLVRLDYLMSSGRGNAVAGEPVAPPADNQEVDDDAKNHAISLVQQ